MPRYRGNKMDPKEMAVEIYSQFCIQSVVAAGPNTCHVTFEIDGKTVKKQVDLAAVPDGLRHITHDIVNAIHACLVKNGQCAVIYYETRKGDPLRYTLAGRSDTWEVTDMSSAAAYVLRELLRY